LKISLKVFVVLQQINASYFSKGLFSHLKFVQPTSNEEKITQPCACALLVIYELDTFYAIFIRLF